MLTIPIKKKWYDAIACGEKREEYRQVTGYWWRRFTTAFGCDPRVAEAQGREAWIKLRNGYGDERSHILCRCRIRIGTGRQVWGAEPGREYFILEIKEVLDPKVDSYRDVLMFIGRFSTDGEKTRREVVEAFTQGCCYWFARILEARFREQYGAYIVSDYVANHFGTRIGGDRVYDITGDVTEEYNWEPWAACEDSALRNRIIRDCINF